MIKAENQKNQTDNQKEEKTAKVVNPVIVKTKLINAQLSGSGNKVGVFLMLYDSEDPITGFCNIQAYSGSQPTGFDKEKQQQIRETISPIVSKWFDVDEQTLSLTGMKAFSDVYAVVSGKGKFMQLHRILTKEQFDVYKQLVTLDTPKTENLPF